MRPPVLIQLLLAGLLITAAGCSQGSFVSRGLSDLGAYFNSYYNAQNDFHEAVSAIEGGAQPVDQTQFLQLFHAPDQQRNQEAFASTIERSADILREHPESHLVDDALMLIGKSYFYLENYAAAQQKFRELINLSSSLDAEARFWLARALAASGAYEEALLSVQESLLLEDELDAQWGGRLHLLQSTMHVRSEQWEEAAEQLQAGLESARDRELRARAWYLLGQVSEELRRYDRAASAYMNSVHERPHFELAFAGRISAVRVEGMHGSASNALDRLGAMQGDDKYYGKRAELKYLEGRLLQEQGEIEPALAAYTELLYQSESGVQSVRGRTHYAMGVLYRDAKNDFVQAAAHFDTAAAALPAFDDETAYAPAAIVDAGALDEAFGSYAAVAENLQRMDSLLALGALGEEAFQEAILTLQSRRTAELEAQREAAEREAQREQFGDRIFTEGGDESVESRSTDFEESGFLYHRDRGRLQENLREFYDRWGERPLAPNWRRLEAIESGAGRGADSEETMAPRDILARVNEQQLVMIDVSAVPRDSAAQSGMITDRAFARYEMGNVLFLQLGMPDSAAVWYRRVIDEDEGQQIVPRAYYALAQVKQAIDDQQQADRLYELILARFPQSSLAARVRARESNLSVSAADDSLKRAYNAYDEASRLWDRGAYDAALDSMVAVAARHPGTPVAPQALLAAGTLYLEWTQDDSTALERPLTLSLANSLLVDLDLAVDTSAITPAPLDSTLADTPPADSSASARSTTVSSLLAALTERYPDSPHAARAELMLAAIGEIPAPPAPAQSVDSLSTTHADTTTSVYTPANEGGVAADSTGKLPLPADSTGPALRRELPVEDSKMPADSAGPALRRKLPVVDSKMPADSAGAPARRFPAPDTTGVTPKVQP